MDSIATNMSPLESSEENLSFLFNYENYKVTMSFHKKLMKLI